MNQSTETTASTKFRVGIFTLLGLLLIGAVTVFVNDKPFWWRPCQLVHINVEDGTGIKSKSPIKSLGIEIGYLKTVELSETHVDLGICITAPVEVLPSTRAYIRGEGFLGDKFVELKPVKYVGPKTESRPSQEDRPEPASTPASTSSWLWDRLFPSAYAAPANPPAPGDRKGGREIPVGDQGQDMQRLVGRVDELVNEMTNLTTNLKSAINPEELRSTMKQLNRTLENASRTLSPEGGLNQTAQRTLGKLEDAIEQLRDQMTRVNKGEGSVGMLLNDPQYAEEIRDAIRNVNRLLGKVGGVRFVVDLGGEQINAYNGGRGYFRLQIYPNPTRYYLLGISIDPRGQINRGTTETCSGGTCTSVSVFETTNTALLFTAQVGKIFLGRLDLAIGALHGDGALSTSLRLGPAEHEELFVIRNDVYSRGTGLGTDDRLTATLTPWAGSGKPWAAFYMKAGIEGFKKVPASGATPYLFGAGITFDDEDIKILFTLR